MLSPACRALVALLCAAAFAPLPAQMGGANPAPVAQAEPEYVPTPVPDYGAAPRPAAEYLPTPRPEPEFVPTPQPLPASATPAAEYLPTPAPPPAPAAAAAPVLLYAPAAQPQALPAPAAVAAPQTAAIAPPQTQQTPLLQLETGLQVDRPPADSAAVPVLRLGPGDAVSMQVFGRPEFDTTTYVGEDQTITVPLAGKVRVGGLSPSDAARQIAVALRDGQFLLDPQVSLTLQQFRSQQVSVLGEVRDPGRFPLESKTTVLDLLALAGGLAETASEVIYLMRPGNDGQLARYAIDLKSLGSGTGEVPTFSLKGGDSLFVPRAEQFYVYGEVQSPNMYRLENGTTVLQAISRSGGLTPRGSENRIEIRRRQPDGKYQTFDADLTDLVQANDVIRVKERIF